VTIPEGSALYEGVVQHERTKPRAHRFRYRVYQAFLDLDELSELSRRLPLFSYNRPNVTSLYDRDYMGMGEGTIKAKLTRWLAAKGVAVRGKVYLLTNLRVLGHVFNPVSYHYVTGEDGRLDVVVAEINNTFGESYAYLLSRAGAPESDVLRTAPIPKMFHISPFISMEASYVWTATTPGDSLRVHIEESEAGEHFFEAFFAGKRRPLTSGSLALALARHPLMPLRVIAYIHWQALRLFLKRVPVFHKPEPPRDALTAGPPSAAIPGIETRRNV
jgi:DUF1365 family protein